MRLNRPLTLAACAALAAAGLADAQDGVTTLTVKASVTPNKAGTKTKPQAVKIAFRAHVETTGDGEKPIVQKVVAYFPKGSLYQGAKFPSCSQNTLARHGVKGCPKGSVMGKGTGDAYADTTITHPDITVVNGGKSKVFFYTILNNPARVQAPVPGVITKLSGKWQYKLVATVPQQLQIVAGVPIALRDLTVSAGSSTKPWLATTSCPKNHKWPYASDIYLDNGNTVHYESSTPCRS